MSSGQPPLFPRRTTGRVVRPECSGSGAVSLQARRSDLPFAPQEPPIIRAGKTLLLWLGRGIVILLLLIVFLGAGLVITSWRALPTIDGTIALPVAGQLPQGPDSRVRPQTVIASVTIDRDRYGIPTIRATSEHDGYFALGWVHAQDRLWQMESMRRLGAGRMAELIGAPGVAIDRFVRTLGLYHLATETWREMPADSRAVLEAYSAGVNAWIRERPDPLPLEFQLLVHEPEPWTPVDSLVWGRLMALWLSGDWTEELLRAALFKRLTADQMRQLWPALAGVPSGETADLSQAVLDSMPAELMPRLASNAWAVSGDRTASGKPLLANDPHLGFQVPIQWYLVRLELPTRILAGATAPGVPFLSIGRNNALAWGFTTTHSDTMDLYLERLEGPGEVATEAGPVPIAQRQEIIKVRFGDDVPLTVRSTRHGPIISDAALGGSARLIPRLVGDHQMLALQATALRPEDSTADALFHINRARSLEQLERALARFQAPQQNITVGTIYGDIARYSPGLVPIRPKPTGLTPTPGWAADWRWDRFIPFQTLPSEINPKRGYVFNTNSRIAPDDYPYYLTDAWPGEDRATRIDRILARASDLTVADMQLYQMDTVSVAVERLLPRLIALADAAHLPPESDAGRALVRLRNPSWKADMAAPRTEPLLMAAWLSTLPRGLFADEMGPLFAHWNRLDVDLLLRVFDEDPSWCDDVTTPDDKEPCSRVAGQALETAMADLRTRLDGDDPLNHAWGEMHRARFGHLLFSWIPGLGSVSGFRVPTGGDNFTLSRGTFSMTGDDRFEHVHGAGLRTVMDLENLDRSGFVLATGQSGQVFSPHYADQLALWQDGMLLTLDGTVDPQGHRLILEPSMR